ncbi:MAG: class I SAM-dependent methyltransferase [Actinomycetota bacterium]|nr:class I SAM-dependent methyltransferase [Actinomycetota bacterium]
MSGRHDVTLGHLVAGVVGLAMMRHWYVDGAENEARFAELRDVLGRLDEVPFSIALNPSHRDLDAGYAEWAASYDGANPMVAAEEAVVLPLLDRLAGPDVAALDAACGTGRHAALLSERGCVVHGIDRSEAMLSLARAKVPAASFGRGDVCHLPFASAGFDLAVVSLALCHLADPTDALVELRRVLRDDGTLVIADPHPSSLVVGGQAFYGIDEAGGGRRLSWVRNHYHTASTWLRAFRAAGLRVEDCLEPSYSEGQMAASPAARFYPEAVRAAMEGLAGLWVWVVRPG